MEKEPVVHHQRTYDEVGLRVLVADDDDELRATLVDALRADGYIVLEAHDGEEMLALLHDTISDPATRPDVIIADVRMPKLSGLGVLAELRHEGVHVPIVMMTGFHPESVEVVAKRLGAIGILRKPFDLDDLRTAVMNAHTPT
jgi:DNA-binding response OmpR family regulator